MEVGGLGLIQGWLLSVSSGSGSPVTDSIPTIFQFAGRPGIMNLSDNALVRLSHQRKSTKFIQGLPDGPGAYMFHSVVEYLTVCLRDVLTLVANADQFLD
ncbi:MAG: hypothetical protein KDE28_27030 [Anaerolineales bacterium]|nr:hypothetical protein [Anaerolineales bacterium]